MQIRFSTQAYDTINHFLIIRLLLLLYFITIIIMSIVQ